MATTALTVVNNVLKRLRESTVTSGTFATNTYAQLILQFVNETKRECEDAWNWTMLRETKTITTAAGTATYSATGAGQRFKFYDPESKIINATDKTYVTPASPSYIEEMIWTANQTNQPPSWYRVSGQDASADPIFEFYPTPDAIYTMKLPLVIPEADLVDYDDTFEIPSWPVELGAWARAISERGEDGGQGTIEQWDMYRKALSDFIAMDSGKTMDEAVWVAV